MTFGISPLTPAYGRDYKSAVAVQEAFHKGNDFLTFMGQYINKPQIVKLGMKTINVRYGQLRKVVVIDVTNEPD